MKEGYFAETKNVLERAIPEYGSADFSAMRKGIRTELKKKENDLFLLRRGLKVIVLGDWNTAKKREKLDNAKELLLRNGIYAETIDSYYNVHKKDGLSPTELLEFCCVKHQLIVFIDGEGPGTITEQNYLSSNYLFHGKVLFFIEEPKFSKLKIDPRSYIRSFPTIIPYASETLNEDILVFSRLRIYRLAEIISNQKKRRKGLSRPGYSTWRERLGKRK